MRAMKTSLARTAMTSWKLSAEAATRMWRPSPLRRRRVCPRAAALALRCPDVPLRRRRDRALRRRLLVVAGRAAASLLDRPPPRSIPPPWSRRRNGLAVRKSLRRRRRARRHSGPAPAVVVRRMSLTSRPRRLFPGLRSEAGREAYPPEVGGARPVTSRACSRRRKRHSKVSRTPSALLEANRRSTPWNASVAARSEGASP